LQSELNEFERLNILEAAEWAFSRRVLERQDIITEFFLRNLHKKMFDQTWKWAGKYRNTDKNIGCLAPEIRERVPMLIGDVRYWVENRVYDIDEIAVRFYHRLVEWIHPFPNGNGRHARLLADIVAVKYGRPQFEWGCNTNENGQEIRAKHFTALAAADEGNIRPLLLFARGQQE
jgi:Fic-DOC domain mobile mystery protein B